MDKPIQVGKANRYRIRIDEGKPHCVEANGERTNEFAWPDMADALPKLYVVKQANEICYVGVTTMDIRKRLSAGFSAKGEHGYYGYKWKDLHEAELLVWSFPTSQREDMEAVEGELVYLIRHKTGKWPRYQMEIHFHHGASEPELQVARSILATLFG